MSTKNKLNHWKYIAEKYVHNYMANDLNPVDYYNPIMDKYIDKIMSIKKIMFDILSNYYCGEDDGIYGGYFRDNIMYTISKRSLSMKIRLFLKLMNTEKHDIDIYKRANCVMKRYEYDDIVDSMNKLFMQNNLPLFKKDEMFWNHTNSPNDPQGSLYNYICLTFKIDDDEILNGIVFGIDFSLWDIYRKNDDITINKIYKNMLGISCYFKKAEQRFTISEIEKQIEKNITFMHEDMYYQLKVLELATKKFFYKNVHGTENIVDKIVCPANGKIHADEYNIGLTLKMYMRFHKMNNYGFNIVTNYNLSLPTKYLEYSCHGCGKENMSNYGTYLANMNTKTCVYLNYSSSDYETRVCGKCGEIYAYNIKKACTLLTISQNKMLCDIAVICL